jgi:hypothetical protein
MLEADDAFLTKRIYMHQQMMLIEMLTCKKEMTHVLTMQAHMQGADDTRFDHACTCREHMTHILIRHADIYQMMHINTDKS